MFAAKNFFLAGGVVPLTVDYLVIAGGGGGGGGAPGGGGGAGGYRTTVGTTGGGGSTESSLTLSYGDAYTVTVGAGGAAQVTPSTDGSEGSDAVYATIT